MNLRITLDSTVAIPTILIEMTQNGTVLCA